MWRAYREIVSYYYNNLQKLYKLAGSFKRTNIQKEEYLDNIMELIIRDTKKFIVVLIYYY